MARCGHPGDRAIGFVIRRGDHTEHPVPDVFANPDASSARAPNSDSFDEGKLLMKPMNRRVFLTRSSMAVAAAGVASAVPGLATGLVATEAEAPAAESAIAESASMTEPLVVHVRDLASGEIGLFSGTREIVVHDPGLASRLFNASR
jgi:hypothetical protein